MQDVWQFPGPPQFTIWLEQELQPPKNPAGEKHSPAHNGFSPWVVTCFFNLRSHCCVTERCPGHVSSPLTSTNTTPAMASPSGPWGRAAPAVGREMLGLELSASHCPCHTLLVSLFACLFLTLSTRKQLRLHLLIFLQKRSKFSRKGLCKHSVLNVIWKLERKKKCCSELPAAELASSG